MTAGAIAVLLTVAVLSVWLGCIGFLRLRAPLDRLHCVAFINVTASLSLAAAGFVSDGISPRSMKMLAIGVVTLLAGAAGAHVAGRAIARRSGA